MPNIAIMVLSVSLACSTAAFAQAANGPPISLATQQSAPEAAQKRPAEAQAKDLQERTARSRETDRPAIGPATTQGLAQDAITRSNRR